MARQQTEQEELKRNQQRPEPDEAPLDEATAPQPEHHEPRIDDPGMRDLSTRDWFAIVRRAAKEMLDDNMPMVAQALAYSTFLAIPSVMLVTLGIFTMIASPETISSVMNHLGGVMPSAAKGLLSGSLHRLNGQQNASLVLTIVGLVLALWSTTGAMTSYMTGVNLAYDRKDRRNFIKKRFTALLMVACMGFAFVLVAVFLIFGPTLEKHIGDALGMQSILKYVWWSAQWPILIAGLLAAFAVLLYLGPDVDHPRLRFLTLGSALSVFIWLAASAGFAFYTAHFSSYNKTWGSLSAVIVMLVWLWLTGLALLFGAEINAEAERSRELRQGEPAAQDLKAPSRA
jgi:membrane protein